MSLPQRPDRQFQRRDRNAFSYAEVVISSLIMGIIASIAVPKYLDSVDRYRLEMSGKRLTDDLAYVQRIARQTGSIATISLSATTHSYQIAQAKSLDRPSQVYDVSLSGTPYRSSIERLALTSDTTSNLTSTTITFDRFGSADRSITIGLKSGKYRRSYSIDARSGRVLQQ